MGVRFPERGIKLATFPRNNSDVVMSATPVWIRYVDDCRMDSRERVTIGEGKLWKRADAEGTPRSGRAGFFH